MDSYGRVAARVFVDAGDVPDPVSVEVRDTRRGSFTRASVRITSIRVVGTSIVEVGDCVTVGVGAAARGGRSRLVGAAVGGVWDAVAVSVG